MAEKIPDVSHVEPDLQGIGKRIREVRFRLGMDRKGKDMPQKEFGALIGITGDLVGKMERGVSTPTLATLVRIAALSGKGLDWLVTGTERTQQKANHRN